MSEIPLDDGQEHTQLDANSPPPCQYQHLIVSISFTLLLINSVMLCEILFAPSDNVSVKLNTEYGNVVLIKKICTKQANPLLYVDKSIKMRKIMG